MKTIGGGKGSKIAGTSYEYRVVRFFREHGWDSDRNALSGASKQIAEAIGKHDVRAKKDHIFLQMECKKTGAREKHNIMRAWLDKIDFGNDEFLVHAWGRSDHFILVPQVIYLELFPDELITVPDREIKGKKQFALRRSWVDENNPLNLYWKDYDTIYTVTDLARYVKAIERRGPLQRLNLVDQIKAFTDIEVATEWYKKYRHRMTNNEKMLYYAKLHRLEEGIEDKPSAEFLASVQWWRDTTHTIIMKCPHCAKLITYRHLENYKRHKRCKRQGCLFDKDHPDYLKCERGGECDGRQEEETE